MNISEFLRENSRLVAMFLIAVVNAFFVDLSGGTALEFLESFFTEFSFTIGAGLVMLTGYIGEKRLVAIEPNTTLTSVVALLTFLLPVLSPSTDWSSIVALLNSLAAGGVLTVGAVFGVIINYFGDIRIGRPLPEGKNGPEYLSYMNSTTYKMRHLPGLVLRGTRK